MTGMSETVTIEPEVVAERDRGGRFVIGGIAGPGRPKGARSKLGEAFLEDLRDTWNELGAEALRRCAKEEPAAFVRIVASLMPRDVNLNVGVDAKSFAQTFRAACETLGNAPPPMKVINGRRR